LELSGKLEERLAKDADVMAAARALDDTIRIENEVHIRTERDIDNVEVRSNATPNDYLWAFNLGAKQVMVDSKECFVRKMNDIRTRTLVERDGLTADQVRGEEMISTRR
jgi:hypothetical protein